MNIDTHKSKKLKLTNVSILPSFFKLSQNFEIYNTYSVERHIILAHKLIQLHIFRILPPFLPLRCVARSDGDISYRRVKPDIENLSTTHTKNAKIYLKDKNLKSAA
jgi:hypothetical protein